jgi:hypothetical protein
VVPRKEPPRAWWSAGGGDRKILPQASACGAHRGAVVSKNFGEARVCTGLGVLPVHAGEQSTLACNSVACRKAAQVPSMSPAQEDGRVSAMEIEDQGQKYVCPPGEAGQCGQDDHILLGHGDSPRAVSITLQPTSGGVCFNRASNIAAQERGRHHQRTSPRARETGPVMASGGGIVSIRTLDDRGLNCPRWKN